ncbi:MAG: DUF2971 domain-containing protein [Opitutaceae bacterium]
MSEEMIKVEVNWMELFFPEYLHRKKILEEAKGRFAYYTSADTAMQILQKKEVWLRNARSMNDFSEVEHGFNCFRDVFLNSEDGKALQIFLDKNYPGIVAELARRIDGWMPVLRAQTYIMCVSEHDDKEDAHGRLSMWRAYGGKTSVAIILKNGPFLNETDAFKAYAFPVQYGDKNYVEERVRALLDRLRTNLSFFKQLNGEDAVNWLFYIFKVMFVCTKHEGFAEEREWRVVYHPDIESSDNVKSEIVSLSGIPQQVYKIPLKNIPEENFTGATIPEFVDRIIIGPSDEAPVLIDAFRKLLTKSGCKDADKKVFFSGIPLR